MMRISAVAFSFFAVCSVFPVSGAASQASTATATEAQQRVVIATRLLDVINPDDRLLAQEMRAWESGIRLVVQSDPALLKLEQELPGIVDSGIAAARPVAREYIAANLTKLKRYKVEQTAAALTLGELQQVERFYSTPAGRRLATGMTAPNQADNLVNRLAAKVKEDGNAEITEQDAKAATKDAVKNVMSDASAEDILAIVTFEATPVAKKLSAVAGNVQKYTIELSNSPDPVFVEKQQKALVEAMLAFAKAARK